MQNKHEYIIKVMWLYTQPKRTSCNKGVGILQQTMIRQEHTKILVPMSTEDIPFSYVVLLCDGW